MMHKSLLLVVVLLFSFVDISSAGWFGTTDATSKNTLSKDASKAYESGKKLSAQKVEQGKRVAQDATAAAQKKAAEAKKKSQQAAEEAKKKGQQAGKEGRSFFGFKKE